MLPDAYREAMIMVAAYLCIASQLPFVIALVSSAMEAMVGHRELMRHIEQQAHDAAREEIQRTGEEDS